MVRAAVLERHVASALRIDHRLGSIDVARRAAWRAQSRARLAALFQELCDELDVRTLIECGAHEADASRTFLRRRSGRAAVAIEANPVTFRTMTTQAGIDGVTVLQVGVGSRSGMMELLIPENSPGAMASFKRQVKERGRVIDRFEVPMKTLDEIDAEHGLEAPLALWIDVEGMSTDVLEGAPDVLSRTTVILVELQDGPIWEDQSSTADVDQLLEAAGFVQVARDFQTGGRLFNGLYVRTGSTSAEVRIAEYWDSVLAEPTLLGLRAAAALVRTASMRVRAKVRMAWSQG